MAKGKGKGARRVSRKARLPELGLDPASAVGPTEQRTASLTIRLTPTERREVREIADHFGVTVTSYLMGLHEQAWEAAVELPDFAGERRPPVYYIEDADGRVGDLASGGRGQALMDWMRRHPDSLVRGMAGMGWVLSPQESAEAVEAAAGERRGSVFDSARRLAVLLRKCKRYALIQDAERTQESQLKRAALGQFLHITEGGE